MENIRIFLSHNNARHEIIIDPSRPVHHLMDKLEEITEIPTPNMKVIASGKTISSQPDNTLTAAGLKSGSKIMLLGKKVNAAEDQFMATLKPIRKDFNTKVEKLDKAAESVQNYENGYVKEAKPIDKEIMVTTEFFMKLLEKLDGMAIGQEHKVARERKKNLVKEIQKQLDRADVLRSRLSYSPTGKLK